MYSNMGPKTTPSLISKGGNQIPPPLAWDKIDTPWEIGLRSLWAHFTWRDSPCRVNFSWRDCPSGLYLEWRESLFKVIYTKVLPLKGIIINLPVQFYSLDILVPSCICDNEASSSDLKFKMYKLAH